MENLILGEDFPDKIKVHSNLANLLGAYERNDSLAKTQFISQIWYHRGMIIDKAFFKGSQNFYQCPVEELDFGEEDAAKSILQAFNLRLDRNLEPLFDFPEGNWVMAQVMDFKANWSTPFDPYQTVRGTFIPPSGREVSAKFMRTYGEFEYQEDDESKYVRIPLGEGLFYLEMIQMPQVNGRLKGFSVSRPTRSMIRLEIPQWEFSVQDNVKELLKAVGLGWAFDIDKADFFGISPDPVWLDQVFQASSLKIDERGISVDDGNALYSGPRGKMTQGVKTLKFNKPFVFLIREKMTGLILYMGKKVR